MSRVAKNGAAGSAFFGHPNGNYEALGSGALHYSLEAVALIVELRILAITYLDKHPCPSKKFIFGTDTYLDQAVACCLRDKSVDEVTSELHLVRFLYSVVRKIIEPEQAFAVKIMTRIWSLPCLLPYEYGKNNSQIEKDRHSYRAVTAVQVNEQLPITLYVIAKQYQLLTALCLAEQRLLEPQELQDMSELNASFSR